MSNPATQAFNRLVELTAERDQLWSDLTEAVELIDLLDWECDENEDTRDRLDAFLLRMRERGIHADHA